MTLHENKELFRQSVRFTAQEMGIPDIYIEKDYWVTFALKTIFSSRISEEIVFKGGTALSKCFNLIKRFSEDIDLVVMGRDTETSGQLKSKIRNIGKILSEKLPEVEIEGVTQKFGMIRKTAHTYSKEFDGSFGQIRDVIILEASWLGHYEPHTTKKVSTYIYSMMQNSGQEQMTEQFGLMPFDILVLEPTRTFCEKIMSLVHFSYTENPLEDLKKKIRHTYDLNQLLENSEIFDFFISDSFDVMLLKVANDDVLSYISNNKWLEQHPKNAMFFADLDNIWKELKPTYNGDFKKLVYADFPEDSQILESLKKIKERLNKILWNIEIKK